MSIPSIVEMAGVFDNPGTALRYLVLHGVLEVPENCSRPACLGRMRVSNLLKPYLYRCSRKRTCGMALSIYKDTFFGSTRLPANKVLLIAYLWLTKSLHTSMITQVGVNANTITNWTNSLRGLVTWDIENLDLADAPIGGEGIIVEIDESKFGKRKYNRGHRVEGIWVVGVYLETPLCR